jgi:hypothetical protein
MYVHDVEALVSPHSVIGLVVFICAKKSAIAIVTRCYKIESAIERPMLTYICQVMLLLPPEKREERKDEGGCVRMLV